LGKKIIIGLTSDEYVKNSKLPTSLELRGASKNQGSNTIENFEIRKINLEKFLLEEKAQDRVEILKIDDLFGSTLSKDLLIDAIVVSEESKKGADIINRKRRELGMGFLKVLIAPFVKAEDGGIISSARIRNGEINRNGKIYVKDFWLKNNLKLTENLRQEFQKPFGELSKDINDSFKNKNNLIITVGDITTKNFNEKYIGQNLSVVDFNVARKKRFFKFTELGLTGNEKILKVDNPAGYITSSLFNKLAEIINSDMQNKQVLLVSGEEDLAVLPLILLSPLGAIIYYGQPPLCSTSSEKQVGIRKIVVSETSKEKTYSLISKLKTTE
jgi:uncharacterized protein (UPF0218 family)/phosphopantetheine adenylyltransferase